MKKQLLILLFTSLSFSSFSQLDYLKMKDTICPSLCGIRDSALVVEIYQKLIKLDTTKIESGMVEYYDDLSHVQYDLCLLNNEDSTFMRQSLLSTERALFHDPNHLGMIWNAAFGHAGFHECEQTHYYLERYYEVCPNKLWMDKAKHEQIAILLLMCPNDDLKQKFKIKDKKK